MIEKTIKDLDSQTEGLFDNKADDVQCKCDSDIAKISEGSVPYMEFYQTTKRRETAVLKLYRRASKTKKKKKKLLQHLVVMVLKP